MRRRHGAALLAVLLCLCSAAPLAWAAVTAAAVWQPPADFLQRFHRQCDGRGGAGFTDCFVDAMARAGAAPAVLAFARQIHSDGWLTALDRPAGEGAGPVALARVIYPFRANENEAWLLVDGTPDLIDVDDERRLPRAALPASPAYRALRQRFPRVTLWPGDRGSDARPEIRTAPDGGTSFIVSYRLQDFCHACAIVGQARFAFAFDRAGRFRGAQLVSVVPVSPP